MGFCLLPSLDWKFSEARRTQSCSYLHHAYLCPCTGVLRALAFGSSSGGGTLHIFSKRSEGWKEEGFFSLLGVETEGYSKNRCGRKDKCSSCSGGRVGGKEVEVRRKGGEEEKHHKSRRGREGRGRPRPQRSAAGSPLSLPPPSRQRSKGVLDCCRQTDLPGLLSGILKLGHFKRSFLTTSTLISDILGEKKAMVPCMPFH